MALIREKWVICDNCHKLEFCTRQRVRDENKNFVWKWFCNKCWRSDEKRITLKDALRQLLSKDEK